MATDQQPQKRIRVRAVDDCLALASAILLALSYSATERALRPIYGSTAASAYTGALFYAIQALVAAFSLLTRASWTLEQGCLTAAFALASAPFILHPGFALSSQLGTTVGPVLAQASLGLPVSLAVQAPTTTQHQSGPALLHLVAAMFIFEASRRGPAESLTGLSRSQEHYALACGFFLLSAAISRWFSKTSHKDRSAQKKGRQKKQKASVATNTTLPLWRWLTQLSVFTVVLASSYMFETPRLALTLPWSQLRRGPQVLATTQSTTGQVAVVEYEFSPGQWLRALKADHSLLGGIWIGPARQEQLRRVGKSPEMADPQDEFAAVELAQSIFNTFYLQEAVRLVHRNENSSAKNQKALIIGLGTGVSARALQHHGVDIAIAEVDPAVYQYAREFFGVPSPSAGLFLEDARQTLHRPALEPFDYIIHDVFTGGAVPASLFTLEFWQDVKRVLRPDGVLAVNFAGDLNSTSSLAILHTLTQAFVSSRAFDDGTPGEHRNMVVFCSDLPQVTFREPVDADYLTLTARQEVLDHFLEREVHLDVSLGKTLMDGNSSILDTWQRASALQHWQTLRDQIPADFWKA